MTRWIAPALALVCMFVLMPAVAQAKQCQQFDRSRGVTVKMTCPSTVRTKAAAHQRRSFQRRHHHARGDRRKPVRIERVAPAAYVAEYEGRASSASSVAMEDADAALSRRDDRVRATRAQRAAERLAGASRSAQGFGSADAVVSEARRWLGTNPTHRRTLWCAAFMNFVLKNVGLHGTGSDLARSFASAGSRVSGPQVGAIAVMSRRGGGHVGVVSGVDASGNPIIISGNHGRKVAETVYPRGRIYAYVMPR